MSEKSDSSGSVLDQIKSRVASAKAIREEVLADRYYSVPDDSVETEGERFDRIWNDKSAWT